MSSSSSAIDWKDAIKKKARGTNNEDLGEIKEVEENYILVQRGMINKDKFYIPKDMVESYDGNVIRLSISEEDAKARFWGDSQPPRTAENEGLTAARKAEETIVPVTAETIDATTRQSTREATIIKEPITETKSVEVPVTHEEICIQRRDVSERPTEQRPVQSKTETKVPIKQEEVEITKQPYVKEEIEPVTETKTISEQVTSEKVTVKNAEGEEVTEEKEGQEGEV